MNVKQYETYLADLIYNSESNENNIENRKNVGIVGINQITSTLHLKSLGNFYIEKVGNKLGLS